MKPIVKESPLSELREALKGKYSEIARNANTSRSAVRQVLLGYYSNKEIISEAKRMKKRLDSDRERATRKNQQAA